MGRRSRTVKPTPEATRAPKRRRSLKSKTVTPENPQVAGEVDIWPILAQDAGALVREVEAGEHDAYLSFLLHCEQSRERRQRPEVLASVRARIARRG